MKALTEIGEIGISSARHDYLLRPSFRAMQSLGSPREIVQLFHDLHSTPQVNAVYPLESIRRHEREILAIASQVIEACLIDGDPLDLLGYTPAPRKCVPGDMPFNHWVIVAQALMRHGIIGVIPKKTYPKKKSDEYVSEFRAAEYVSAAVAHLGVSESEAWDMTMTSFAALMRSKFGEPEQKTPALEDYDDAMKKLEEINRLRSIK